MQIQTVTSGVATHLYSPNDRDVEDDGFDQIIAATAPGGDAKRGKAGIAREESGGSFTTRAADTEEKVGADEGMSDTDPSRFGAAHQSGPDRGTNTSVESPSKLRDSRTISELASGKVSPLSVIDRETAPPLLQVEPDDGSRWNPPLGAAHVLRETKSIVPLSLDTDLSRPAQAADGPTDGADLRGSLDGQTGVAQMPSAIKPLRQIGEGSLVSAVRFHATGLQFTQEQTEGAAKTPQVPQAAGQGELPENGSLIPLMAAKSAIAADISPAVMAMPNSSSDTQNTTQNIEIITKKSPLDGMASIEVSDRDRTFASADIASTKNVKNSIADQGRIPSVFMHALGALSAVSAEADAVYLGQLSPNPSSFGTKGPESTAIYVAAQTAGTSAQIENTATTNAILVTEPGAVDDSVNTPGRTPAVLVGNSLSNRTIYPPEQAIHSENARADAKRGGMAEPLLSPTDAAASAAAPAKSVGPAPVAPTMGGVGIDPGIVRSQQINATGDIRFAPMHKETMTDRGASVTGLPIAVAPLSVPGQGLTQFPNHAPYPPPALQVAQAVVSAMNKGVSGQIELILRPQELGHIRFEMTTSADKIHVVVFAERPDSLDLLRRNADLLMADLRQSGFGQASLSFENGSGRDQQGQTPSALQKDRAVDASDGPFPMTPMSTATRQMAAEGRLDLRL